MLAARHHPTVPPGFPSSLSSGILLGFLAALAACASTQVSVTEVLEQREPLVPDRFPGAARLLSGFDPQDPSANDSIPESILFGLELDLRGRIQRWLLKIEVREPFAPGIIHQQIKAPGGSLDYDSRRRRVQVTLLDSAGKKLGGSTVYAPWDFLTQGFVCSCELAQLLVEAQPGDLDYRGRKLARAEAARQMFGGFATLTAFLRIIRENELLSSMLWKIIDRPSVFSILFHGGVSLSLNAQLTNAKTLPDSHLGGELSRLSGYRTTLRLSANGSPVLDAIVWVTEPESPYRLSGGIVAIEGFRPSDPKVRFRMEILAARR